MDDTPKTLVYSQAVLTTIKEIFCQNSGEEESASHIWLVWLIWSESMQHDIFCVACSSKASCSEDKDSSALIIELRSSCKSRREQVMIMFIGKAN